MPVTQHDECQLAQGDRVLRICQLTDMHLFGDPDGELLGVNTQETFDRVLNQSKQINADGYLFTGDIAQESQLATYQRFFKQLDANYNKPYFCLSGNHDDDHLSGHFANDPHKNFASHKTIEAEHWCLILLNSSKPNQVYGTLDQASLDWLAQQLHAKRDKHIMIALHHQPTPVGSAWIDDCMLDEHETFWQVLNGNPHVKAVVSGHVHQAFDSDYQGIRVMTTPSTSVQFAPHSEAFTIDNQPAGYRWFECHPDGSFNTSIERIDYLPTSINAGATGY